MTVYVAVAGMYSSQGVVGVYASVEAAKEANSSPRAVWGPVEYVGAPVTEWTNGLDWEEHISIEAFEVEGVERAENS